MAEQEDAMDPLVSYRLLDGVATIVMDDGKVNALSRQMLASVTDALGRAASDGAVVVLTGRAGIFSGGFDLKVMNAGGTEAARMLEEGFELALRLLEHPTPVVIACNGHAVAMGVFLLLSGNYRIGADGPFRIVANEVAIGLTMPWAAIEICRQRLTPSAFNRVVNLAEPYAPSGGVAAGLLDRVVDEVDLLATATTTASGLAGLDRTAHQFTKRRAREAAVTAIRRGLDQDRETFRRLAAPDNGQT
jgi:enoyl-CoA hydratase